MATTRQYIKRKIIAVTVIASIILTPVLGYLIWVNLPVSIRRLGDIKFAEGIIKNIDEYRIQNGLPADTDWQLLKQLGFKEGLDFITPGRWDCYGFYVYLWKLIRRNDY